MTIKKLQFLVLKNSVFIQKSNTLPAKFALIDKNVFLNHIAEASNNIS